MAGAPTLLVACLGSVIGGTGNGVQWVAVMTALQEAVEDDYQARAARLLEAAAAAVPGTGYILRGAAAGRGVGYIRGGALTGAAPPGLASAVSAVGAAVVVAVWARRPIVPDRVT